MLRAEKNYWCPMAEQAISLIYQLAEHPDVICADIIKKQAAALLPPKTETLEGPLFDSYCFSAVITIYTHCAMFYDPLGPASVNGLVINPVRTFPSLGLVILPYLIQVHSCLSTTV